MPLDSGTGPGRSPNPKVRIRGASSSPASPPPAWLFLPMCASATASSRGRAAGVRRPFSSGLKKRFRGRGFHFPHAALRPRLMFVVRGRGRDGLWDDCRNDGARSFQALVRRGRVLLRERGGPAGGPAGPTVRQSCGGGAGERWTGSRGPAVPPAFTRLAGKSGRAESGTSLRCNRIWAGKRVLQWSAPASW